MRRLFLALSLIIISMVAGLPSTSFAADPKNKGLFISPLRTYTSLRAGDNVTRAFTVANLTEKPIVVSLSVEQFSMTDYAYDYRFNEPKNNWISLVENRVELKPYQSHEVPYRLNIPKNAPAGGQYYTLLASTDLSSVSLGGTVRAATLLYLTIDGKLIRTSEIEKSSLFPLVVSTQIPYSFDIKNTGNIHYFAYISASIDGVFYHAAPNGVSQLLMPGTTRQVEQTIPSPLLPGIYKVTYGYKPDQGNSVERSQFILFIPPWFMILLAIVSVFAIKFLRRRKRPVPPTDS